MTIHHSTMPGEHPEGRALTITEDWRTVTCPECKLERPLEMPREYRTPQHVKDTDARLTAEDAGRAQTFLADTLPRAALLHRRIAKTKALEDHALECLKLWAQHLAEAVRLREDAERALAELLPGGQAPGVAQEGTEKILAQNGSERVEFVHIGGGRVIEERNFMNSTLVRGIPEEDRELRTVTFSAPVNAVDIRTEEEEDEVMELSEQAKAALINTQARQGAEIPAAAIWLRCELVDAGLMGRLGGLTRKGTIVRARLVQAAEDAAFG